MWILARRKIQCNRDVHLTQPLKAVPLPQDLEMDADLVIDIAIIIADT